MHNALNFSYTPSETGIKQAREATSSRNTYNPLQNGMQGPSSFHESAGYKRYQGQAKPFCHAAMWSSKGTNNISQYQNSIIKCFTDGGNDNMKYVVPTSCQTLI